MMIDKTNQNQVLQDVLLMGKASGLAPFTGVNPGVISQPCLPVVLIAGENQPLAE